MKGNRLSVGVTLHIVEKEQDFCLRNIISCITMGTALRTNDNKKMFIIIL